MLLQNRLETDKNYVRFRAQHFYRISPIPVGYDLLFLAAEENYDFGKICSDIKILTKKQTPLNKRIC